MPAAVTKWQFCKLLDAYAPAPLRSGAVFAAIEGMRPAMACVGVAVAQVMPAERHAPRRQPDSSYTAEGTHLRPPEAVPPEQLEPEDDPRGRAGSRRDDDPQRCERLIRARRQRAICSFMKSSSSMIMAKSSRAWAAWRRVKRSGSRSLGMSPASRQ